MTAQTRALLDCQDDAQAVEAAKRAGDDELATVMAYRTMYGTYKVELRERGARGLVLNRDRSFETTNRMKAAGVMEYLSGLYAVIPANYLGI